LTLGGGGDFEVFGLVLAGAKRVSEVGRSAEFPDIDVLASEPVRIPALRETIATAIES
jgi:hypothetical protein